MSNVMQQFSMDLARVRDVLERSGLTENGGGRVPTLRVDWWIVEALTAEQASELLRMQRHMKQLLDEEWHREEALVELCGLEDDFDQLIAEIVAESDEGIAIRQLHSLEETLAAQYNRFAWGGMSLADLDDALVRCAGLFGARIGDEHRDPLRSAAAVLWDERRGRLLRPNVGPVDIISAAARVTEGLLTPNARVDADVPAVAAVFREAVEELVRQGYWSMDQVQLLVDERAGDGGERQFAYCMQTGDNGIAIAFAPRAERLPKHNLRGLVFHELGHALEFEYGVKEMEKRLKSKLPAGIEPRADAIAEQVFGIVMRYDRNLVQCAGRGCRGTSPRPASLG